MPKTPDMHDRRSVRKSGTQRVRIVRRKGTDEAVVSGFASRGDALSRVAGGIGAVKRTTTPTYRETEVAGAPAVINRGARGESLRMGWQDASHASRAASEGIILDGTSASRVNNLDCFLTIE